MKNSSSLNRRAFLKSSALSGGGLLISFSFFSKASAQAAPGTQPIELNGFVKILPDNRIQIMSPNPEGGQGVKTSMPMIVAEELDVDWKQVEVIQADLDTKHFTRQFIGGSQAIHQGWKPLRTAGATARQLLREAAALQWNVPTSEISTEAGVLSHSASGKSATYGQMAQFASTIPVPTQVALKAVKDFKIIGKSKQQVDIRKIVSGQPLFGIDTRVPGMLIAMVRHPPAFGMTLKSVDAARALKMPGIKAVFPIKLYNEGSEKTFFDTTTFPEVVAIVGRNTWEVMQAKKSFKSPGSRSKPILKKGICSVGKSRKPFRPASRAAPGIKHKWRLKKKCLAPSAERTATLNQPLNKPPKSLNAPIMAHI